LGQIARSTLAHSQMTAQPKIHYEGLLAKPIPLASMRSSGSGMPARHSNAVFARKLRALCECYKVDPEDVNLEHVLTLARRYVPGFQIERKRRPRMRKWDDVRLAQFWLNFSNCRPRFQNDISTLTHMWGRSEVQELTGPVELAWLRQLLDKARRSPLVQLLASPRPSNREFARQFMNNHQG